MATIRTLLSEAYAQSPSRIAVRWKANKTWHDWKFGDVYARARAVAEVLGDLGVKPGDRVALMMENRPEWIATYLGITCCGITAVPIDAKLQPHEVSHIMRDSEAVSFIGSGHVWNLLREVEADLPKLRTAVMLDGVVADDFRDNDVHHYDYETLIQKLGGESASADSYFDRNVARETDVASIIYTSGTTGRSKGAMLTHANFLAQMAALDYFTVTAEDNFLLVLPLHHAFAFTACLLVPLRRQCEVSMVESLRTIPENMRECKPSVLLAVPLLAEKMLDGILKKLRKSAAARILMGMGLTRVIGKKVIEALGGKLRIIVCGGAASDPAMLKSWNKFGVKTLEGYGLTETAPISALAPENDIRLGSVGKALPGHELRIADPNEEGIGEIEVKGPSVMKGYFRNEDATKECFDGDWFRTGDLGKLDPDGYLTITGRKKSLIVNREGKNIYPEEVELVLNDCPHILESLVLGYHVPGEVKGEHVGAIVVPDIEKFTQERRASAASPLSDDEIKKICLDEVHEAVKALSTYKHPRRLQVRMEPFMKTNTLKIKRYLYSLDSEEG